MASFSKRYKLKKLLKSLDLPVKKIRDIMTKFRLIMFDMDGTLLKDRGIFVIAEKKNFLDELLRLINYNGVDFYLKSIEIAKLTKGMRKDELLDIFRKVPMQDNLKDIIKEIKEKKIKTAIATDSYFFLADDLKNRLGLDYVFANNLLIDDGIITGNLEIHNKKLSKDLYSGKIYSICKSDVLENLCKNLDIEIDESIAIGDGKVDIGMIKKAGLGIAFNGSNEVQSNADISINDMKKILDYI